LEEKKVLASTLVYYWVVAIVLEEDRPWPLSDHQGLEEVVLTKSFHVHVAFVVV
jgi:hypothetical protein